MRSPAGTSPHHPVRQVRHEWRVDHADLLQRGNVGADVVLEQPRAAAEQHRRDVDPQLVQQAGFEVLLANAGAATDRDVLAAGRGARLLECGLDSTGDEGEGRAAFLYDRLASVVGEDEYGVVEGRLGAPPRVRVG